MSNYKRFYNKNYKYVFFTIVTYNRKPILLDNIELLRSSFKKFVNLNFYQKDWCNFDDKNQIIELDFE